MKKAIYFLLCLLTLSFASSVHAQVRLLASRSEQFSGTWSPTDSANYIYSGTRGSIDAEGAPDGYDVGTQLTRVSAWSSTQLITNTFDGSDRLLNSVTQLMHNGSWRNSSRYVYTYDGSGNTLSVTGQSWDTTNSQWLNVTAQLYTYDAQHHATTQTQQNTSLGPFSNYSMDSMSYDGSGNKIKDIYFTWNGSSWQYVFLSNFEYNGAGKELKETILSWNAGQWLPYGLDSFSYNGSNSVLEEDNYSWNSGFYNTDQRYVYQYDISNNNTIKTLYLGDVPHTGWVPYHQDVMTYDAAHNLTSDINSYYTTTWVNSFMVQQTFSGNQLVSKMTASWNNGAWQNANKYDFVYNANGYVDNETDYLFQNNNWAPSYREFYWYQVLSSVKNVQQSICTSVYPNPCTDNFEISFNAGKAGTARLMLYDITGKLLTRTETQVFPGSNHIRWDAFKLAAGTYLYQLYTPEGTGKGKIEVQ